MQKPGCECDRYASKMCSCLRNGHPLAELLLNFDCNRILFRLSSDKLVFLACTCTYYCCEWDLAAFNRNKAGIAYDNTTGYFLAKKRLTWAHKFSVKVSLSYLIGSTPTFALCRVKKGPQYTPCRGNFFPANLPQCTVPLARITFRSNQTLQCM